MFCSFRAMVLRIELQDRLERKRRSLEWAGVLHDLDRLQEVEMTIGGKSYVMRTKTKEAWARSSPLAVSLFPPNSNLQSGGVEDGLPPAKPHHQVSVGMMPRLRRAGAFPSNGEIGCLRSFDAATAPTQQHPNDNHE